MAQWQRRTFSAQGLTQVPHGPHVGALARRSARIVRVTRRPGATSIGPYSERAGQNLIAGAGADQYGNASGSEYDLIDDGSIIEAKVVVLNLCSEVNLYQPKAALERKELLRPLVYGSNGRVVTACFDHDGCRAIVDGGFTRLYHKWESAGTDRYIINAAAWLLNIERFDEGSVRAGG